MLNPLVNGLLKLPIYSGFVLKLPVRFVVSSLLIVVLEGIVIILGLGVYVSSELDPALCL